MKFRAVLWNDFLDRQQFEHDLTSFLGGTFVNIDNSIISKLLLLHKQHAVYRLIIYAMIHSLDNQNNDNKNKKKQNQLAKKSIF